MGRKTRKMYSKQIVPKLEHFCNVEMVHADGNSILFPQYKPIILILPTDKSAT